MAKYRSKIVEIEAEQYNGPEFYTYPGNVIPPQNECPPAPAGVYWDVQDITRTLWPLIKTLEGTLLVRPGDWIITGTEGEKYPCKPSVFARKYEAVPE